MIFQRNILVLLRQSKMNVTNRICNQPVNWLSDSTAPPDDKGLIRSTEIGSFAKAFEKFSALQTKQENFEEKKIAKSFLTLLRESKFMQVKYLLFIFINLILILFLFLCMLLETTLMHEGHIFYKNAERQFLKFYSLVISEKSEN